MPFRDIKDLLAKYREYVSRKDGDLKTICAILTEILNTQVLEHNIAIKKGKLSIKGDSVFRNELFLHKEGILRKLHERGMTAITEIE